jgi:integrase
MKANVKIAPEQRQDLSKPLYINGEKVYHDKGKQKGKQKFEIIKTNVPLFADIRFSGTRLFYFTGYRVDFDSFDFDKQEIKKNNFGYFGKISDENKRFDNKINKKLTKLKGYIAGLEDKRNVSKEEITTALNEIFKKSDPTSNEEPLIDNSFFAMFEKYLHNKVSTSKARIVKSVINHWRSYEAYKRTAITFEAVTVDLLRDFEAYLKTESTRTSKVTHETKLVPKGRNTIHTILKISRAFWRYATGDLKQQGIEIHYPFGKDAFEIQGENYGDPIYITIAERDILFNTQLESEKLQRVRDIFVFQCLIGARVGDLCKLTKANIQNDIISYIPRKTKDNKPIVVNIPLHPKAIEILKRYNLPGGLLLPFISDQRYNDYIKDLFEKVNFTRLVTRLNPTTGEEEQVRLCDIASSHMARRAFVGNLYGKVDNGIIGSMSGHTPGSKSFARYYTPNKELQQQAINIL